MPYTVDNRVPDLREQMYFPEIFRGIGLVARRFFKNLFFSRDANPDILARDRTWNEVATLQYPEERVVYPPGYRGLHRLVPREDGKPRCVACYMCATACPAQCIYIEAGEYADDPIEKYPVKFVIDEAPVSYQNDPWLKRGSPSIPAEKLEEMRARARPVPTVATDEASQTPGFSVRALALEAKQRGELVRGG